MRQSGKAAVQPGQGKGATLNSQARRGKAGKSIRRYERSRTRPLPVPGRRNEGTTKGKGVTPATLYYPHIPPQMRPKSCR